MDDGGAGLGVLSHAKIKMIYPMDIAIISLTLLSYKRSTIISGGSGGGGGVWGLMTFVVSC